MKIIDKYTFDQDTTFVGYHPHGGGHIPIFEVTNYHKLNQLLGYAKYINRDAGHVYFRGQATLYDRCLPSIIRGCTTKPCVQRRLGILSKFLSKQPPHVPILKKIKPEFHQALYQHYGINTRWIDLVDNIWVALWFGMHEFSGKTYEREYVYVRKRKADTGWLFVLLVFIDANQTTVPGYYTGIKHDLVDLRVGVPSMFLRPHAQHGLLAKCRGGEDIDSNDFMHHVCGIVRISMQSAYDWMGDGRLLSHINMFPSPIYDYGYAYLLEKTELDKSERSTLGSIKIYTLS